MYSLTSFMTLSHQCRHLNMVPLEAPYPGVYIDTFILFLRSLCKIIWMNVHYFPNAPRINQYINVIFNLTIWKSWSLEYLQKNQSSLQYRFICALASLNPQRNSRILSIQVRPITFMSMPMDTFLSIKPWIDSLGTSWFENCPVTTTLKGSDYLTNWIEDSGVVWRRCCACGIGKNC